MSIGQNIRKTRSENGMTQTELANKIGITKQLMYKYEMDVIKEIPIEIVAKAAKALDTGMLDILGIEDTITSEERKMLRMYREADNENKKRAESALRQ